MAMFGDICIPTKDDKTLKWDGKGVEPSSACGNPLSFKATQPGSSGLITATAELPNGNKLVSELKIIIK
jgi:hypothetical protein